jgi:hypothetical protein
MDRRSRARLGGFARRLTLSPERRSEIARIAIQARYRRSSKKARVAAARKAAQARWARVKATKPLRGSE